MTVAELIERLQAANPNSQVIIACENACDPHPIAEVFISKFVTLYQNDRIYINPRVHEFVQDADFPEDGCSNCGSERGGYLHEVPV